MAEDAFGWHPDSEPVRSALGWALYDRDVKTLGDDAGLDRLRIGWTTCERLRELLVSDPYGKFSAWVPAVLRTCNAMLACSDGSSTNRLKTVVAALSPIDADKLSRERFGDIPSPMERHALLLTKALYRLEDWERLRKTCLDALARVAGCRDTELWLRHRVGLALLELDAFEEALPHLEHVAMRKQTQWWAHHNVGRGRAATGDSEGAMRALATALKGRDLHMKTHVMVALANVLRAEGDAVSADRHHRVAREIRIDQGWRSTPEIDAPLGEPPATALPDDASTLQALWETLTAVVRERGRIVKVFENGGAGFLELDGGKSVYFAMPREAPAPAEGTRVSCRVIDVIDAKKQKPSSKAIDVRPEASP